MTVETYLDETHGDYGVQLSLLSYTTRRELEDHLAGYVQPHDGQVEHATLSDQSGTLRIRLPGMSLIEAAYTIAAILELDGWGGSFEAKDFDWRMEDGDAVVTFL